MTLIMSRLLHTLSVRRRGLQVNLQLICDSSIEQPLTSTWNRCADIRVWSTSDYCTICPAGTYSSGVAVTTCLHCTHASSVPGSTSARACTCDPGYYRSSVTDPVCVPCPSNYVCVGGEAQPATCPPYTHYTGTAAAANSTCYR